MNKLIIATASMCLMAFAVGCGGTKKRTQRVSASNAPKAKPVVKVSSSCSDENKTKELREADVDGDGRPDLFKYYKQVDDPERPGEKKNALVRQDIDLNWDGKLDVCRFFDASGVVYKEEFDLDYDGKVDELRMYEEGTIVESRRDRNNDGRFDVVRKYKNGKLTQKETDTNDDGNVDRWEYYDGNTLDRIGIDLDHDGKVDRWAKSAR